MHGEYWNRKVAGASIRHGCVAVKRAFARRRGARAAISDAGVKVE
jgi:hypothetical protein